MDNTDTLLDFGDDSSTVHATQLSPTSAAAHNFASSAFDPFSSGPDDPFASTAGDFELSANKGAPATNNSSLFDDFDPFLAPTSSAHASPSKQHLDMEHHQESTSPDANGFADAFDPLASGHDGQHDKQHHDEVSGGLVDVASDRGQDGAGSDSEDPFGLHSSKLTATHHGDHVVDDPWAQDADSHDPIDVVDEQSLLDSHNHMESRVDAYSHVEQSQRRHSSSSSEHSGRLDRHASPPAHSGHEDRRRSSSSSSSDAGKDTKHADDHPYRNLDDDEDMHHQDQHHDDFQYEQQADHAHGVVGKHEVEFGFTAEHSFEDHQAEHVHGFNQPEVEHSFNSHEPEHGFEEREPERDFSPHEADHDFHQHDVHYSVKAHDGFENNFKEPEVDHGFKSHDITEHESEHGFEDRNAAHGFAEPRVERDLIDRESEHGFEPHEVEHDRRDVTHYQKEEEEPEEEVGGANKRLSDTFKTRKFDELIIEDYQPPKHQVKVEPAKKDSKAPEVYITPNNGPIAVSPVKPAFLADIVAKRVQGDDDDRATTNEDDRRERKNSNGPISDAAWGQPIGEEVLKSSVPIGSLRARYEQQQNQQQQPEHPKPNIPSATVVVNKVQHQGKALDPTTAQSMQEGGETTCKVCSKKVFEMEKLVTERGVYHKACFRCVVCSRTLTLTTFSTLNGQNYCQPHFLETFKNRDVDAKDKHMSASASSDGDGKADGPGINQLKTMFENTESQPGHAQAVKKHYDNSDYAKPAPRRTEPVNGGHRQTSEDEPMASPAHATPDPVNEADERPPEAITRTLVARWREMETTTAPAPLPRSPSIRARSASRERDAGLKVAPPPVEPARAEEDELPPAAITRSLISKFQVVDDQPVPSPSQAKVHQHKPRNDIRRHSPDRRAQGDIVNASSRPDDSPVEAEKELPEEGFTRGLVAQWRVKEQTTGKQVPLPSEPTKSQSVRRHDSHSPVRGALSVATVTRSASEVPSRGRNTQRASTVNSTPQRQLEAVQSPVRGDSRAAEYEGDDGGENFAHIDLAEGGISENEPIVREDVIRATDPASDPLPPAKLARSLADKFETMSTATRGAVERAPSAGRKDFKWSVKEAGPKKVGAPSTPTASEPTSRAPAPWRYDSDSGADGEHSKRQSSEENDYMEPVKGEMREEEMPPPNTARSMLAKFQTMESRSLPPPSPARTQTQLKMAAAPSHSNISRGTPSASAAENNHRYTAGSNNSHANNNHHHDGNDYEGDELYENVDDQEHIYESVDDVHRHQQPSVDDGLPEEGTTASLLAKFKSMQSR